MKKNKNLWKIFAVIVAAILILYWLFAATMIDEDNDANPQTAPELIEQTN